MFGKCLYQLRREKGLKQSELGVTFDLSPSAIGSYEREEREPTLEQLIMFADFFDVSLDYLVGKTQERMTTEQYRSATSGDIESLFKRNITIDGQVLTVKEKRQLVDFARLIKTWK